MKTSDTSNLSVPDVIPFRGNTVVVRLYKKQKWYVGFCWRIKFDGSTCYMWLDPFLQFGLGHQAIPWYPDTHLFDECDWPIPETLRTGERPFVLIECTKSPIVPNVSSKLIAATFTEGAIIISQREVDILTARKVFRIDPADVFKDISHT